MAIGFGVSGAGATDLITTTFAGNSAQRSWFFVASRSGAGGSGNGRIFSRGTPSAPGENVFYSNAASSFRFGRPFSTTSGTWAIGSLTLDSPIRCAIAHDASSTANSPIVYSNGASISVSSVTTPVGSYSTSANPHYVGSTSDAARNWDGWIAELAIWNRLLTNNEMLMLSMGAPVLSFGQNLVFYMPLLSRDYLQQFMSGGGAATRTGCLSTTHPLVVYPN